ISATRKQPGPTTPHSPKVSLQGSVWTLPISLAANLRISIDFSSTSYLDASVRRVPPPIWEFPRYHPVLEAPFGNLRIEGCVRLPGAYRSLPRPSPAPKPSHPSGGVSCRAL